MSDGFRNDAKWWRRASEWCPDKAGQSYWDGRFTWHPAPSRLKEQATPSSPGAVVTSFTDATSKQGWGATSGVRFAQGVWPREAADEDVNWKEIGVSGHALSVRGDAVRGNLASVRMDSLAAASYANYGAGRPPAMTMLARGIKGLELAIPRTLAALRICQHYNSVAGALSRIAMRVEGRGPFPDCRFREKFRGVARKKCDRMDGVRSEQ